jgi:hypothetical protein
VNQLRNQRPHKSGPPPKLTLEQRRERSEVGAQWSSSQGYWIGWLWDGLIVTTFEYRTTRSRALDDAWKHYDRLFHAEEPARRWAPAA